jgi:predicted secreted protein
MECKAIELPVEDKPAVSKSKNNKRILEAVKSGKAMVIQQYNGKCLVRYEYSDEEGTIVVLAEKLPCVSGTTENVDFSWHKVVTVYTSNQASL